MTKFVTRSEGRFHVHVFATDKFRTRHMSIKLEQPMDKTSVTERAVLPYLWMEGTSSHPSARDIMRYADELFGASVRTFINKRANRHVLEVQSSVPEAGTVDGAEAVIDQVWQLMVELLTDPLLDHDGFPADSVQRERGLHEKRIQSTYDDKISFALERCLEETCAGTPEALPRLGFAEDLPNLNGQRLWTTHQNILSESDVHVYLVGNVRDGDAASQSVLQVLQQTLGSGARKQTGPVQALALRSGDVKEVTDRQPVQQGKLNLGLRTGVSYGDPNYLALLVANGIFGGFPHSKLFMNVRERASLAYYASSRLDGLTGIVAVQTGIEVANKERAQEIILQQLKALQAGEITDDELEFTKRGLRNQYQQVLDQPLSMAEIHFSGVLAGIHREVSEMLNGIAAVTKEQATEAAQNLHLDTVYFLASEEVSSGA